MFTEKYLIYCFENAFRWKNRSAFVGDMFSDFEKLKMNAVSIDMVGKIDFASRKYAYIPNLDELMDCIDVQIKRLGGEAEDKKVKIEYKNKKWKIEIRHYYKVNDSKKDLLITSGSGESFHELLIGVLLQLTVVYNKEFKEEKL